MTNCSLCDIEVNICDEELIDEVTIEDTESLLYSQDTMKQKIVYVCGYLAHKFKQSDTDMSEKISCEFLDSLNRGKLHVPTLNTVFFVHCGYTLYEKLDDAKKALL